MELKRKRIYDPFEESDGYRIMVDRLWPRGVSKDAAHLDAWMKELAPSTELRKLFGHDPEKWKEFHKKYLAELKGSSALDELLSEIAKHKVVTLLFSARSEKMNNAIVLEELINQHAK